MREEVIYELQISLSSKISKQNHGLRYIVPLPIMREYIQLQYIMNKVYANYLISLS